MSDEDRLLYTAVGPLGALLLGVALVPVRELTVASNFTVVFVALTILVGEFGGRMAALATALVSALSLDFFLTRPYMRLAMHDKNDLVAFVGLTGCGLLAAALGTPRRERETARRRMNLVQRALRHVEAGGPPGSRLQQVAEAAVATLPLAALAVRDDEGTLVAGAGDKRFADQVPASVVGLSALAGELSRDWRRPDPPLPGDGLRVALIAGARPCGWLDVWGSGRAAGDDARRSLTALAGVAAALLEIARRQPPEHAQPSWTVGSRRSGGP
jgi:hypothetical protein